MVFDSQFCMEDIGPTADEVFNGLINHGLLGENYPPCFSSDGLAAINDPEIRARLDAEIDKELAKTIGDGHTTTMRYAALRDKNVGFSFIKL